MWQSNQEAEDDTRATHLSSNAECVGDEGQDLQSLLLEDDDRWMPMNQQAILTNEQQLSKSIEIPSKLLPMNPNQPSSRVNEYPTDYLGSRIYPSFSIPVNYGDRSEGWTCSPPPKCEDNVYDFCPSEIGNTRSPFEHAEYGPKYEPIHPNQAQTTRDDLPFDSFCFSSDIKPEATSEREKRLGTHFKRERRRERNRQSAVRCRQRFKALTSELEQKSTQLLKQQESLQAELQHLELENRLLREQVDHLISLTQKLTSASVERNACPNSSDANVSFVFDQSTGLYYINY